MFAEKHLRVLRIRMNVNRIDISTMMELGLKNFENSLRMMLIDTVFLAVALNGEDRVSLRDFSVNVLI
ncbi:MAG: hypothetical protein RJB38_430, partial [Pseudomonadota bacterium]